MYIYVYILFLRMLYFYRLYEYNLKEKYLFKNVLIFPLVVCAYDTQIATLPLVHANIMTDVPRIPRSTFFPNRKDNGRKTNKKSLHNKRAHLLRPRVWFAVFVVAIATAIIQRRQRNGFLKRIAYSI